MAVRDIAGRVRGSGHRSVRGGFTHAPELAMPRQQQPPSPRPAQPPAPAPAEASLRRAGRGPCRSPPGQPPPGQPPPGQPPPGQPPPGQPPPGQPPPGQPPPGQPPPGQPPPGQPPPGQPPPGQPPPGPASAGASLRRGQPPPGPVIAGASAGAGRRRGRSRPRPARPEPVISRVCVGQTGRIGRRGDTKGASRNNRPTGRGLTSVDVVGANQLLADAHEVMTSRH